MGIYIPESEIKIMLKFNRLKVHVILVFFEEPDFFFKMNPDYQIYLYPYWKSFKSSPLCAY